MRMTSLKVVAPVALVLVGGVASTAVADDGDFSVNTRLSGYEEVAAVSSDGAGDFSAKVDRSDQEITYTLEFGDLGSAVQQAHIHFGQRSVNGDIAVFLCSNLGNGPAGTQACPQEGTITGTITPADVIGPANQGIAAGEFDELVDAIRARSTYVNVHSATHRGGEIRGQLSHRH